MSGLAQKLYMEKGGKALTRFVPMGPSTINWTDLEEKISTEEIAYVDYALAQQLLREYPEANTEVAALICQLSAAAREGHLCLESSERTVLPDSLVTVYRSQSDWKVFPTTPLCRCGNRFYLQRYWVQETIFIENFVRMLESTPALKIDPDKVQARVNALQAEKRLLPEQAQGIMAASKQSLTIICGGPGTGKTYTAGLLFNILWDLIENPSQCQIALAAPTGKAAANLHNSLAKAFGRSVEVKTLHALLGLGSFKEENVMLSADLVLVDECSMIDANLMGRLLASIKPGARLILLGDRRQLPPVEAGSLFSDMMTHLENIDRPAVELKTCLRAELQEIIQFAERINKGDNAGIMEMISTGKVAHHLLPDEGSPLPYLQKLFFAVESHFLAVKPQGATPQQLLKLFDKFRLLSPLRKGPLGVDEINHYLFRQLMRKVSDDQEIVIPIMIVQNDKRLELSNGEVGVLITRKGGKGQGDYALFPSKDPQDDTPRQLPSLLLPRHEYAYCLSVHKSQGSEFENVLLVMPTGSEKFGREVLYTAATRARKKLEVWSSLSVLAQTISQQKPRLSGVINRLHV